jgi:hypothetical protein
LHIQGQVQTAFGATNECQVDLIAYGEKVFRMLRLRWTEDLSLCELTPLSDEKMLSDWIVDASWLYEECSSVTLSPMTRLID